MESSDAKVCGHVGIIRIREVIAWFAKSPTMGICLFYVMVVTMPIIHIVWYISICDKTDDLVWLRML